MLEKLYQIITKRQKELPDNSYVADLLQQGENRILQKIGEEAIEVILAAKSKSRKKIIAEVADLYFHTLVLLATKKITPAEVYQMLEKRRKK